MQKLTVDSDSFATTSFVSPLHVTTGTGLPNLYGSVKSLPGGSINVNSFSNTSISISPSPSSGIKRTKFGMFSWDQIDMLLKLSESSNFKSSVAVITETLDYNKNNSILPYVTTIDGKTIPFMNQKEHHIYKILEEIGITPTAVYTEKFTKTRKISVPFQPPSLAQGNIAVANGNMPNTIPGQVWLNTNNNQLTVSTGNGNSVVVNSNISISSQVTTSSGQHTYHRINTSNQTITQFQDYLVDILILDTENDAMLLEVSGLLKIEEKMSLIDFIKQIFTPTDPSFSINAEL